MTRRLSRSHTGCVLNPRERTTRSALGLQRERLESRPALGGLGRRSFLTLASGAALAAPAVLSVASPAAASTAATVPARAGARHAALPPPPPPAAGDPDFGPNVYVFDSNMDGTTIQASLDAIYAQQQGAEFGQGRYALLFKPGGYGVDIKLGYYMHVAGLGLQPVRHQRDRLAANAWRRARQQHADQLLARR